MCLCQRGHGVYKTLMKYKILFLFIIWGAVLELAAQGRVKLTGRVYDSDNQPIELATVRVAGTTMGTMTDLKGEYQLSIPAGDSIVVIYSCLGYREEQRQLLNLTKDVSLSVRLNKNSKMLDEVVVATHRRQTSTLQTIDTKDLKLMPDASGGSIEAMLTTFAGVNSSNELSSQYSVRGGNFDENIVYINGIEVYRPLTVRSGQQEGLSIINPDMVGAVGFSSGGFSAEYGDKMSSVLDIIYKHPEAFEGSVSASFLGATASIGQSTKKFSQLHGIRYKTNSTLLSSLDTKGEYEPSFFDYQTYLTYKFAPKWEASFLGNIAINDYKFTPHERNTSFGTATNAKQFKVYFDGGERDKFETYFGALSLNFFPDKYTQWALMTSAFVTNELVTYDISGEYWLDELADSGDGDGTENTGALGVGTYHEHARNRLKASVIATSIKGATKLGQNELKWGLTHQYEKIYDRVREWEMRDSAGYSLPHTGQSVEMIYNLFSKQDMESHRLSAYLQDTYRLRTLWGRFIFTGGVRASYWGFNKETLVSPRASITFIPAANEQITARVAGGLYYQSPFYKELRDTVCDASNNYVVQLNRNIKSQRSIHVVLGGDYSFRALDRPFKFTAELYYKKLDNLIPYTIDNVKVRYYGENCAKGYAADPKNTQMALWLAQCYCEMGEYDKGVEVFEAVAAMQGPKFEEHAAEANRLIALYTNNEVAKLQAANDYDGIIAMSDKLLAKNPANALAEKIRLQAYLSKKDYAKVIELGEAAAAAQTDEAEKSDVYFTLGAAYNAKEMKPQAIEALKKVVAGDNVEAAKKSVAELSK